MDARALAALAANPGCSRRALLDGAGVDKAALATALGSPSAFGQSQFALARGNAFEARVKADGGAEILRLTRQHLAPDAPEPEPGNSRKPELTAQGPEGRLARTALALREAAGAGAWTVLDHPLLSLDVAGTPAHLEPDAIVVHPGGRWTIVEIKSFPMIDSLADPAKVGAAARQSAVYVLALQQVARHVFGEVHVDDRVLLVCPKDFSNLPVGAPVDVRRQLAVTRRQLGRLTRVEDIAATLPEGTSFAAGLPPEQLQGALDKVPAAYAPECLATCELAFHCRASHREEGAVTVLGRGVRAELGALSTVEEVLATAAGDKGDPSGPAVASLRRAARLRAEALGGGPRGITGGPAAPPACAPAPAPEHSAAGARTNGEGEACH